MFIQKLGYKELQTTVTESTYRAESITLQVKGGSILVAGVTIPLPGLRVYVTINKTNYTIDGALTTQAFSNLDSIQFIGPLKLYHFKYETAIKTLATLDQVDHYFSRKLDRKTWSRSTDIKRQKAIHMASALINRYALPMNVPQVTLVEAVSRLAVKYLEGYTPTHDGTVSFHGIAEKQGSQRLGPNNWPDPRAYQILARYIGVMETRLDRV